MSRDRNTELEHAVERYCAAHPHAADTVDGVRRWWLGDPTIALDDVAAVLEVLVTRRVLDVRCLPNGVTVFFNRAARERGGG